MRQLFVIFASLLASTAALPCSTWFPNFSDFGPSEWHGREDIPANWVFTALGVQEEFGSWWAKKREDGAEFERLKIEFDPETSVMRILPHEPFDAGARYDAASFIESADELSAWDLLELEPIQTGSFSVVAGDEFPPSQPVVLASTSEAFVQFEPGALCYAELITATSVRVAFLNDANAGSLHIREVGTGELIAILRPHYTRETVPFHYTTEMPGVRLFTAQAYDLAGNASPTLHFQGDAGGEGACSGAGQGESIVCLLFLAFAFRRRSKERVKQFRRGT